MLITLPNLLTAEQCETILKEIEPLEWKAGQADDKEYTAAIKHNQELNTKDPVAAKHLLTINQAIVTNKELSTRTFPLQMLAPRFNRYDVGQTYKKHTDAAYMGTPPVRTDMSITVFLSDPDSYEGGELEMEYSSGECRSIKGQAGTLICYPTDVTHCVAPVTKGSRIAAITWIRSAIQDFHKRGILSTVRDCTLRERASNGMETKQYVDLMGVQQNLLRMWAN